MNAILLKSIVTSILLTMASSAHSGACLLSADGDYCMSHGQLLWRGSNAAPLFYIEHGQLRNDSYMTDLSPAPQVYDYVTWNYALEKAGIGQDCRKLAYTPRISIDVRDYEGFVCGQFGALTLHGGTRPYGWVEIFQGKIVGGHIDATANDAAVIPGQAQVLPPSEAIINVVGLVTPSGVHWRWDAALGQASSAHQNYYIWRADHETYFSYVSGTEWRDSPRRLSSGAVLTACDVPYHYRFSTVPPDLYSAAVTATIPCSEQTSCPVCSHANRGWMWRGHEVIDDECTCFHATFIHNGQRVGSHWAAPQGQRLDFDMMIYPHKDHLGKAAEFFVVVLFKDQTGQHAYFLTPQGWQSWAGQISDLGAFHSVTALRSHEHIVAPQQFSDVTQVYQFFYGYRVRGENALFFNGNSPYTAHIGDSLF
jgi:hypothetical protein